MKQISRTDMWFDLNFPLWFLLSQSDYGLYSQFCSCPRWELFSCMSPKTAPGLTYLMFLHYVCFFHCLTTQKMTSQCLSEHTVPISARFHHIVPSLADLSPLAIMSMNSYIWPIGISFQDQELSPHLKVLKLKVIWDSQVEKMKIIAFLICQIY